MTERQDTQVIIGQCKNSLMRRSSLPATIVLCIKEEKRDRKIKTQKERRKEGKNEKKTG
jgi:hypothetical protein